MRLILITEVLPFILMLTCCSNERAEVSYFEDCTVAPIDLTNGLLVSDSLDLFSIVIPNGKWNPARYLDQSVNSLIVGDSSRGYLSAINISQFIYDGKWDWEEEQKIFERENRVLQSGLYNLAELEGRYFMVPDEMCLPPLITFSAWSLDPINNRYYLINLTVEYDTDYKDHFCELKSILESFSIKS
jgi:hypothetical protein